MSRRSPRRTRRRNGRACCATRRCSPTILTRRRTRSCASVWPWCGESCSIRWTRSSPARVWSERKALRDLRCRVGTGTAGLDSAPEPDDRRCRSRPVISRDGWATLQQRIGALQVRLAAAETAQSNALAELAVVTSSNRRQRLQDYRVQAQFALATIYDQAAHPGRDSKTSALAPAPIASAGGSRP